MDCEWDDAKNAKNLSKHGIAFEYAVAVFFDEKRLEAFSRTQGEEVRRFGSAQPRRMKSYMWFTHGGIMAKLAESSRPGKLVRKSAADIQAYVKSAKFKHDAALSKAHGTEPSAPELELIPEFGGLDPSMFRPLKEKVTTRIDADVLHWLRRKPKYQTLINEVLRSLMASEGKTEGELVNIDDIKTGKIHIVGVQHRQLPSGGKRTRSIRNPAKKD